jgi:serine/threonine protein kinase
MSSTHHYLAPGTRIDSFEIGRVLGIGGFGITYKGYDHTLSCDVAIKEYLPSNVALRAGDGITVAPKSDQDQEVYSYGLNRFLDEARILAKFKAPSIVRVSRFLEGNGTAYLIMDYEDGQPLNAYLKGQGALSEQRLLSIVVPILKGLRDVHAQGYLHRDIKPGNIYLRKNGSPVLLDFGAARQSMEGQTAAVTSMVTPGFAPIEQYNTTGKQGPWTDLYGIGATLYRCISGANPVGAPDRMMALQAGDPDPLSPAISVGASQYTEPFLLTVDWMLRPNIADRPQSVDAVLAKLPAQGASEGETGIGTGGGFDADYSTGGSRLTMSSTQWRSADLEQVVKDLATQIGPMAKLMVKEASKRTSDIKELYVLLADSIPTEESRAKFLKKARVQDTDSVRHSRPTTSPSSRSATTGPTSTSHITGAIAITDEIVQRAEKNLTSYVGPLAKMLVKKAVTQTQDAHQLVEILARQIDSPTDREKFLSAMKI